VLAIALGCEPAKPPEVVVYTSIQPQFCEPILKQFTRETGISVWPKFDMESAQTDSIAETMLAERDTPRCDLFWNNEILNTLRLRDADVLRSYVSLPGLKLPSTARASDGTWYGIAASARVLIVNTNQIAEARRPKSIEELTDRQWYDRVGIAKPLFGTTATHAVCLFAAWGDERAARFFHSVKRNGRILAGNRQVAEAVAGGALSFGLTDAADAMFEIEQGAPVTIVYPDQGEGELGTLFIPNSVSLVAGSPNQPAAEQLLDFLLSPAVAFGLASGPAALIPLRADAADESRVKTPQMVRAMEVNWDTAAEKWDSTMEFLKQEFLSAD
jgi:iron(III) transport system substrate-binding protein